MVSLSLGKPYKKPEMPSNFQKNIQQIHWKNIAGGGYAYQFLILVGEENSCQKYGHSYSFEEDVIFDSKEKELEFKWHQQV